MFEESENGDVDEEAEERDEIEAPEACEGRPDMTEGPAVVEEEVRNDRTFDGDDGSGDKGQEEAPMQEVEHTFIDDDTCCPHRTKLEQSLERWGQGIHIRYPR